MSTLSLTCTPVDDSMVGRRSLRETDGGGFSFHIRLPALNWSPRLPDLDRFCRSGDVLDDVAIEGSRSLVSHANTIHSHANKFPKQSQRFANAQAEILKTQSTVMQSQFSESWNASLRAIAGIPSAIAEFWNHHADIYHHNQRLAQQHQQQQQQLVLRR